MLVTATGAFGIQWEQRQIWGENSRWKRTCVFVELPLCCAVAVGLSGASRTLLLECELCSEQQQLRYGADSDRAAVVSSLFCWAGQIMGDSWNKSVALKF